MPQGKFITKERQAVLDALAPKMQEEEFWGMPKMHEPPMLKALKIPIIGGDAQFAQDANRFMQHMHPQTLDNIRSIHRAPVAYSLQVNERKKLKPESGSYLGGSYEIPEKRVYVAPKFQNKDALNLLLHEFGHASGMDEIKASAITDLLNQSIGMWDFKRRTQ